jgi:hypothetical protein
MLFKRMIPVALVLLVAGLVISCKGPSTETGGDANTHEESISQDEETALESSMEMNRDMMRMYIDSTEDILAKLDEEINSKKEEADQLEEDARIMMEQHLELIQERRDRIGELLDEMKIDLEELVATVEDTGTETADEVEDTFLTEFEQKKKALEQAIAELESLYNEAFPGKEGEEMPSD